MTSFLGVYFVLTRMLVKPTGEGTTEMANKRKILKSQSKGELTFRTVKTKLNGRTYYRGVLEPRPVMTTEQFAECLEELGCQVKRRSIEMVLDYIRDYAPEIVTRYGGRVQVGPFTVYPALMGRFAAEDSEFDPKTNRIAIKAKTRMSFKYETGGIRLRNAAKAATEQPALVNAFDATTQKEDGVLFTGADAIAVGDEIGVDAGKSDEGVTLKKTRLRGRSLRRENKCRVADCFRSPRRPEARDVAARDPLPRPSHGRCRAVQTPPPRDNQGWRLKGKNRDCGCPRMNKNRSIDLGMRRRHETGMKRARPAFFAYGFAQNDN